GETVFGKANRNNRLVQLLPLADVNDPPIEPSRASPNGRPKLITKWIINHADDGLVEIVRMAGRSRNGLPGTGKFFPVLQRDRHTSVRNSISEIYRPI